MMQMVYGVCYLVMTYDDDDGDVVGVPPLPQLPQRPQLPQLRSVARTYRRAVVCLGALIPAPVATLRCRQAVPV